MQLRLKWERPFLRQIEFVPFKGTPKHEHPFPATSSPIPRRPIWFIQCPIVRTKIACSIAMPYSPHAAEVLNEECT